MHSYSVDSEVRRGVYVALALAAFLLPAALTMTSGKLAAVVSTVPQVGWPLSFGATFSILFLIFDRFVWKWSWVKRLHAIPDLGGKWEATGISSYQSDEQGRATYPFVMKVTIHQTFSRIEIFAETEESTSRSTMAGLCLGHAVGIFRYAFENAPKNAAVPDLHRHPGLIELRINGPDSLQGDYFSGKHRLRFGELTLRRVEE